jgi:hypothetical protein
VGEIQNKEPAHVEPPPKLHKTIEELRQECEERDLDWAPGMSVRVLQAMVDDALDPQPDGSFIEEVEREEAVA